MKKLFIAAIAALTLLLTGCASVPMGDAKQDAALKSFPAPSAGKAAIYIYRNETFGAAIKMAVMLDGNAIGETVAQSYLYREVEPGRHTVASKSENTDSIDVDLRPGMVAYIWQEVKLGFALARTKLHQVGEAEGRKGVAESKLAIGR